MVSLETETDRTLFFDLLPLDVGVIGGLKVRLQLYTVPGQVFYNATRKLVLKGVDGIVFVADSQVAALDANVESLGQPARRTWPSWALKLDQVPFVLQYNKRDIRNILPIEKLNAALNGVAAPTFEAAALHGIGVFETLKAISKLAIGQIRRKAADDSKREPERVAVAPVASPAPAVAPVPLAPAAVKAAPPTAARRSAAPPADNPLLELVGDTPTGEVEFAEQETGEIGVRPVETREHVDIHHQLEKLRTIAAAPPPKTAAPPAASSKDLEKRLADMLVPGVGRPSGGEAQGQHRDACPPAQGRVRPAASAPGRR